MAFWDITTAAASLEFDTQNNRYNPPIQIDSNHFINFWMTVSPTACVQVFTVNTTTWAVTTAAARLDYNTEGAFGFWQSAAQIDSNHFILFFGGCADAVNVNGHAQVFEVNTTTWAVTTAGARFEFEVSDGVGTYHSCAQIDSNHFINFWQGPASDGFVQTFTVNTTTWAVTTAAAALEFDTVQSLWNSCFQIDANHFINYWQGNGGDGFVQVFTVNTTTWAVTTAAARLEFDTTDSGYHSCAQIDANHFIVFRGGVLSDGFVQTFTVNTTTWAVTTAAAALEFDTDLGIWNSCAQIDSNHFINFWAGPLGDGYAQTFTVNTSTWAVTTAAARLDFEGTMTGYNACAQIDSNHFINFWAGPAADGFVQVFTVDVPVVGGSTAIKEPIGSGIIPFAR